MNLAKYAALFAILASTFAGTGCAFEPITPDPLPGPVEPSPGPVEPTRIVSERTEISISSTKHLDRLGEVIARRPETTFHLKVTTEGWTEEDFELLRAFLDAHTNVVPLLVAK